MHGCGLTRSISTEEAEDLSFLHREGYIIHGTEVTEGLHQMFHFDDQLVLMFRPRSLVLQPRGIEDGSEVTKDLLGRTNTLDLT